MVKGLLPEGWKSKDDDDVAPWLRIADGHEQDEYPGEQKPEGMIAVADEFSTMAALMSIDLSKNEIGADGAKLVAEAIKVNVSCLCDSC